jgi:uncharacterized protein
MAVLKLSTPGVYVQEIASLPPSVAEVETAIPAFIGYTEKADSFVPGDLRKVANKINNFSEFVQFYGGPAHETNDSITVSVVDKGSNIFSVSIVPVAAQRSLYNLYYSVKHFYDNGGGTCYIVSMEAYQTPSAVNDTLLLEGLDIVNEIDEVTILSIPESTKVASGAYTAIVNKMITQAATLKDRFALVDPLVVTPKNTADPNGNIDGDALTIRNATLGVTQNRYAAAYYPNVVTTYEYMHDFNALIVDAYTVEAGATLSVPGYAAGMTMAAAGAGSVLYAKVKEELKKVNVVLPPSPAVAGLYARVDSTKGVWKAPANETLLSVTGPSIAVSSREQENLNVDPSVGKSINVIRSFPGYGTLVWGARTLNGNDNEWRYISVRRFFNMVEESIKKSIQWAVFEPNTISTWVRVQAMIENYLFLKFREGALAGAKPEQAFYVRVGLGSTMTSLDVLEGRMNVEIGMAVARPAEFIVLSFTQLLQQA